MVMLADCALVAAVAGVPFAEGPWCWLLKNVQPVTSVTYRGRQRLWDVPDELVSVIGGSILPAQRRKASLASGDRLLRLATYHRRRGSPAPADIAAA
jgi:hypothetical protein